MQKIMESNTNSYIALEISILLPDVDLERSSKDTIKLVFAIFK